MKIILDTCAILWAIAEPSMLSKAAKNALLDPESQIKVLAISSAEIACAVERKKITLNSHWKKWFRKYTELNHWEVLPISLEIIEEAYCLPPPFHKDPADRMIVAAARTLNSSIITADEKILSYPHVDVIW